MATTKTDAWVYQTSGYPQCLHRGNLEIPTQPATSKHIIVKNHAAALNPVDIQLMNMPLWSWPIPFAPFNATKGIGEDFAGEVIAAGSETGFKPGDHVMGLCMSLSGSTGTLSDVLSVNCPASVVCHKPSEWSWEQAASLPLVWLTARTCIESIKHNVPNGGKVAVLGGSSSTGMYCTYIAKRFGWKVLATCSSRNADFVRNDKGADVVVDYTAQDVSTEIKKFAPHAIIDCVGGTDQMYLSPRYVTIVGDKTSRAQMGGAATYLWQPQMLFRWALGKLGLGLQYDCVNLEFSKAFLQEALDMPQSKITIDSTFPMDQVPQAFERLNTGRARGKVAITINTN